MAQQVRPLRELVWFQEGPGVRNHQYRDSGVKLLNVANLTDGRIDLSKTSRYISQEEAYGRYKRFLADAGDLVVAASGIRVDSFDEKMGFVTQAQLPLCMNTGTIRFKVRDASRLDIRYFMYYLKSDPFKAQLSRQITGSAQLNFGPSHLERMDMPVCSLERQREAVRNLDKACALEEKLAAERALLDTLAKARFAELFGDMAENPKGYPVVFLEDVCTKIVDCPHSTPKDYVDSRSYPAIRTMELKNGTIDWSDMKYVSPEEYAARTAKVAPEAADIVYAREGTYGEAALLPEGYKFCLGQRVVLLRADRAKCTPEFLWFSLRSDYVYHQAREKNVGATVGRVNLADIKRFRILLPDLEKQSEFTAFLEKIRKLTTANERSRQQTTLMKKALMREYFEA